MNGWWMGCTRDAAKDGQLSLSGSERDPKPTDMLPHLDCSLQLCGLCREAGAVCCSVGSSRPTLNDEIGSSNPLAHSVNRRIPQTPLLTVRVSGFLIIIKLVTLVTGEIKVMITEV